MWHIDNDNDIGDNSSLMSDREWEREEELENIEQLMYVYGYYTIFRSLSLLEFSV
jgi:hypothetical protein